MTSLKGEIMKIFNITDLGEINYFLGIEIERRRSSTYHKRTTLSRYCTESHESPAIVGVLTDNQMV